MEKQPYHLATMILVFFVLYIYQGFLYGYTESVKFLLKERGVGYERIALFDLVAMPNYLKFFFAPVLDIYYSKKIGKRMTYISLFSIVSGGIFIFLAFSLERLIENGLVLEITGLFLALSFAICVQDVAIDSLVEEVFRAEHTKFGPLMQTLGQIIGPLLSFNAFILLSDRWRPIGFYFPLFVGVFIPLSTLWVLAVVRENKPRAEFASAWELVAVLPNFVRNANLRLYLAHLLANSVGFVFWRNALPMLLIDLGFGKSHISELSSLATVLGVLFMFVLFRMDIAGNIFKYMRLAYLAGIALYLAQFLLVWRFERGRDLGEAYLGLLLTEPLGLFGYLEFSAKATFANLICDYSLSSTFLAIIASLTNFSNLFFKPIFSYLMSLVDYKVAGGFFLGYSVVYYVFVMPRLFGKFAGLKREDFSVGKQVKGEKQKSE